MEKINFEALKSKIQDALQEKLKAGAISGETQGFTLIDGFITLTVRAEVSNDTIIGGPIIPVVGIVGNKSGLIYSFALKALLPDVQY